MSQDLIDTWRRKALDLEVAAQGYNSKCVHVKGVQCLLRARTYRECADALEKHEARKAATNGSEAQAADAGMEALAADGPVAEAPEWPSATDAQRADQAT